MNHRIQKGDKMGPTRKRSNQYKEGRRKNHIRQGLSNPRTGRIKKVNLLKFPSAKNGTAK
jgi:hypothetical protein